MMNLTLIKNKGALVAALALSLLSVSTTAKAGHYTVDGPTWLAPVTPVGDADAWISGQTVNWYTSADMNGSSFSFVHATVQWRIVWHADAPGETAPASAVVRIARFGNARVRLDFSQSFGAVALNDAYADATAIDSGILKSEEAHYTFAAGQSGNYAFAVGDLYPSHRGYYLFDGSQPGSEEPTFSLVDGEWVAYVAVSINSASLVHASGSYTSPRGSGLPYLSANGFANTTGQYRLIDVGGQSINSDF